MTHPVYYFVVAGSAANDPSYLTRDAQRVSA